MEESHSNLHKDFQSCIEDSGWHIRGNVKPFINYETELKRLYYNVLDNGYRTFNNKEDFANMMCSDLNQNTVHDYFVYANKILCLIEKVIPQKSKRGLSSSVVVKLQKCTPTTLFSFLCYHSLLMNICDYFHLHRSADKYKTSRYLISIADNKLGVGVVHYAKVAINLFNLINQPKEFLIKRIGWDLILNNIRYNEISSNKRKTLSLEEFVPYADLAYKNSHGSTVVNIVPYVNSKFRVELHRGRFSLPFGLNGFIGFDNKNQSELILGFRGTDNFYNKITDLYQYLVGDSFVYRMALGLLIELRNQEKNRKITVVGHSLGGGLSQFSVAGLNGKKEKAVCFNSAGLSNILANLVKSSSSVNIEHLYLRYDQVFMFGNQLGSVAMMKAEVANPLKAHKLDTIRENCTKNNKFKKYKL